MLAQIAMSSALPFFTHLRGNRAAQASRPVLERRSHAVCTLKLYIIISFIKYLNVTPVFRIYHMAEADLFEKEVTEMANSLRKKVILGTLSGKLISRLRQR